MAETKPIPPPFNKSSLLCASIISPTTVRLYIRKSRSASDLSVLQQEVHEQHQMSVWSNNNDSVQRSLSLPSGLVARPSHVDKDVTLVGGSEIVFHSNAPNTGDVSDASNSDAVGSCDRIIQLEEQMKQSKMTVPTLEKTISHMKDHIEILEGQLKEEAQNSQLLKEELEASRQLCCQLHEACSRGDIGPQYAEASCSDGIKCRFVQTLPDAERMSEGDNWQNQETRDVGTLCKNDIVSRIAEEFDENIRLQQTEIADLQQKCKEREFQVKTLTHQLSGYISRSTKLEAEQVSLKENYRRAMQKVNSKEDQLRHTHSLLERTVGELSDIQESKVSLMEKCAELEQQADYYQNEVVDLKDNLFFNSRKCRTLNRKIQILNESLENKQGEVEQKETALETKNTILDAIKTIAFTSSSPGTDSVVSTPREDYSSPHNEPTDRRNVSQIAGCKGSSATTCGLYEFTSDGESPIQNMPCQSEKRSSDTDSESGVSSSPYQDSVASSTRPTNRKPDINWLDNDADDEGDDEDPCEADLLTVPNGEDVKYGVEAEGLLLRKHEQENYAMRSRDRSWRYVYVVQHGTLLWFYETRDHKIRGKTLHDESPVDLTNAYVSVALEYTRRKHVFRLKLVTGQQFLFQARDDREMVYWVCCMDSAARCQTVSSNGIPPSIGSVAAPKIGSPSKGDRIKRVIKGSISALSK